MISFHMTWISFFAVCLVFTDLCSAALTVDLPVKTTEQIDAGVNISDKEFYPKGKTFLFSLFSVLSPDLEKMKKDGFTVIGPYYGSQQKVAVLHKAKTADLKCIYRIGIGINFHTDDKVKIPSKEELYKLIQTQMAPALKSDRVICWYSASEEMRWWHPKECKLLKLTYEVVKELDPLNRPFFMYEPNARTASSLTKMLKYQDYSAKGMYVNLSGHQNDRVWCRWSTEQEIEAIKLSGRPDIVPICVPEMNCDPAPEYTNMIPLWTRHDIYCSLVNGAKGVVIWSGFRRGGFSTYNKYYAGYASVAREINGPLNLGKIFLFGKKKNDLSIKIIEGKESLDLTVEGKEHTYPSVSILNTAYNNKRYLFLVNSDSNPVKMAINGFDHYPVTIHSVLEGKDLVFRKKVVLSLGPYGVIVLQVPTNALGGGK